MAYTLKSKVGELFKDPVAVKILEKYVPGISKNPMLALAKGFTLTELLSMPQASQYGITKEMVEKVLLEIEATKKK